MTQEEKKKLEKQYAELTRRGNEMLRSKESVLVYAPDFNGWFFIIGTKAYRVEYHVYYLKEFEEDLITSIEEVDFDSVIKHAKADSFIWKDVKDELIPKIRERKIEKIFN
ncbi:hypothetical protein [Flavobacteriaceae bacterium 14752]|uniref:hypothetical protein n=1 Tax=Mesohalobacter salilacus TaxID=2491711 RepID=UPI000F630F6C|nr:hypothetical protein EIG84_12340 [Flavobacteriaceae bacterium 14752]